MLIKNDQNIKSIETLRFKCDKNPCVWISCHPSLNPPTDPLWIPKRLGLLQPCRQASSTGVEMNYTAFSHLFLFRNPAESCCIEQKRGKKPEKCSQAPPARLHLRIQVVKLASNCINRGLCLPVAFMAPLSHCTFYTF